MRIEVIYAESGRVSRVELDLHPGATVADALAGVAGHGAFAELDLAALPTGVFGAHCERDRVLVDGDRVELYRPLVVDPKTARRQRAARQAEAAREQARAAGRKSSSE